MNKVRILIADDHGIVRKGLRLQLEQSPGFEVVGEAADGREAVRLADELSPNVVVMDIAMPNLNGIEATSQIIKRNSQIAVIILSMHSDESYLMRTLAAGAKGYLLKGSADVDLYMRQLQQRGLQDTYALLTDREKEIFQLLAEGRSNKEVAVTLDLSTSTVETHRTRIMQKLDLHSSAEIVLYAVRKKIIS
jgi:two-component system response regulator NreC